MPQYEPRVFQPRYPARYLPPFPRHRSPSSRRTLATDHIEDADTDTYVHTDYGGVDEDTVRFVIASTYRMRLNNTELAILADFPIVFDGFGGDTKIRYNSSNQYLEFSVDGNMRLQL